MDDNSATPRDWNAAYRRHGIEDSPLFTGSDVAKICRGRKMNHAVHAEFMDWLQEEIGLDYRTAKRVVFRAALCADFMFIDGDGA